MILPSPSKRKRLGNNEFVFVYENADRFLLGPFEEGAILRFFWASKSREGQHNQGARDIEKLSCIYFGWRYGSSGFC